jgi:CDP-diacylglycerol--glycerol-3-phosphate 3-phosphatidyltransferase
MTFADQLTVARAVSVPIVILLFAWDFPNHAYWATGVFSVAMLTDQVDGWLARRSGKSTDLGKILDPVADKILVMAALIVLVPVAPGWMVAVIVAREFLVSGLRLAALERGVVVSARDLSKVKTWLQGIAVFLAGLAAAGAFSDDVAWWATLVAMVMTLVSGLEYAWQAPSLLRGRQPA